MWDGVGGVALALLGFAWGGFGLARGAGFVWDGVGGVALALLGFGWGAGFGLVRFGDDVVPHLH